VVLGLGTAGGTGYWLLASRIESYDTTPQLVNRPAPRGSTAPAQDALDPFDGRSVNLLIIGSDSRDGANRETSDAKDVSGMRSDTLIIAHIAANRQRMILASIPRDTLVDIPECTMSNGSTTTPVHTKINAAFAFGAASGEHLGDAAACIQQTVETVTGVRIDGWTVIDFAGFSSMVDALGGVKICVDRDMSSTNAKLDITMGCHKFDGKTALAYARARKGKGMPEGSDLARIGRQQQLMVAILKKAASSSLLTDLPELYRFAGAALDAAAFSEALGSVKALAGLARSLRSIPLERIELVTAPYVDAGDRANVLFSLDAPAFFDSLAEDRPLVGATPTPAS